MEANLAELKKQQQKEKKTPNNPSSQKKLKLKQKKLTKTETKYHLSPNLHIYINIYNNNNFQVKKTVKKKVKKLVSSKKKTKRPTLKLSDELKNSKMMNVQVKISLQYYKINLINYIFQEITADDIASGKYTQEEIEQFNKIQEYKKKLEEYSDTNTTDLTQEITIE